MSIYSEKLNRIRHDYQIKQQNDQKVKLKR